MQKNNNQKQQRKQKANRGQFVPAKLSGQLKSKLLGVNVSLAVSTWDVRSLSNIQAGTSENERIGLKLQLKQLRCRQIFSMPVSIAETAHRIIRQLIVVVHAPTTPGNNGWLAQLFFDGLSASVSSLVNYHFDPFNKHRFTVVSDRTVTLNARNQTNLSDTKHPLNFTT